jgi:hypothetical protein
MNRTSSAGCVLEYQTEGAVAMQSRTWDADCFLLGGAVPASWGSELALCLEKRKTGPLMESWPWSHWLSTKQMSLQQKRMVEIEA